MSSGLAFDEGYDDPLDDVAEMLFVKGDMAKFAASKPLVHPPGTYWNYSSGTSMIVARILRDSFATEDDYLRYPRERLFGPLGMRSAVIGPTPPALLPARRCSMPRRATSRGSGCCFFRTACGRGSSCCRAIGSSTAAARREPCRTGATARIFGCACPSRPNLGVPPMPEDAYYFLGHDEQIVAIVPSRDLVVVRLGLTQEGGDWDHARDLAPIVAGVSAGKPLSAT